MKDSVGFLLLIQVVLILLNAIFASAEIAVLSFNEIKLNKMAEQGNRRARRLSRLTKNPAKFLATIQVAITLSGFLGSAFAAENFSGTIVDWLVSIGVAVPRATLETLSVILITLILSYFTLIFGELVPKRIAMKKAEQLSLALSGLISGLSLLFTPIVWLLSVSTNAVLHLFGIDPNEDADDVSEEEIRMMVDAGSEKGAIDHEEKRFIQNVFDFDDLTAGDIATHRTDTIFLRMEDSAEDWDQIIHGSRYTLYPICDDSRDDVVGILNAKDYFRLKDKSRENVMANAVREAYFVPESIKADVLFRNMRQNRISLAVVLDEYGGMVGIITRNDLLEQLVGSLNTEEVQCTSQSEPTIEQAENGEWHVHGNLSLRELEEALDFRLENHSFDTVTGIVFDRLSIIPEDGEQQLHVRVDRLEILVTLVRDHQVSEAKVRLMPVQPREEE